MLGSALARSAAKRARGALRRMGVNVHPWPSKRHLVVDYPVETKPRYGGKVGPHPQISSLLESKRGDFQAIIDEIAQRTDLLRGITAGPTNSDRPYWDKHGSSTSGDV